jgi:hypothetical protein
MAKNELGIDFGNSLGDNIFIDTESGKVIPVEGSKEEPKNEPAEPQEPKEDPEKDLIEIPDEPVEPKEGDDNIPSSGENADDDEGDSSSLPTYKVLAKALHEKGILSELDEKIFDNIGEDDDPTEKIFELIKTEIEKNAEAKFSEKIKDLPDDIKKLVGEGGVQAQVAPDIMSIRQTLEQFEKLDEDTISENQELQKNLVFEALRQRGYSDQKIKKRIEQFESLGELEDEAKDAVEELKVNLKKEEETLLQEAKKRDEELARDREKQIEDLKKDIFDSDQIIEGMKLTDKEKQQLFDSMTKVVDKDENGNPLNAVMATRLKNPIAFEKALHYYHALGLFNFDDEGNFKPDLSKIKSSAKASAVDELSKVLKTEQRTQTGRPPRENKLDSAKLKERIKNMKSALPV